MCLAIPGKVVKINKDKVVVDYGTEKREADCSLMRVKVGDYVIVSNKFVVEKLSKEDALKALEVLNES